MRILRLSEVKELPEIRDLTPEEVEEAKALAKADFTAEDLQLFTELDQGTPMELFLQELEETQRQADERLKG
jgi:hypothetical protein